MGKKRSGDLKVGKLKPIKASAISKHRLGTGF
jgi:hypothetical protein